MLRVIYPNRWLVYTLVLPFIVALVLLWLIWLFIYDTDKDLAESYINTPGTAYNEKSQYSFFSLNDLNYLGVAIKPQLLAVDGGDRALILDLNSSKYPYDYEVGLPSGNYYVFDLHSRALRKLAGISSTIEIMNKKILKMLPYGSSLRPLICSREREDGFEESHGFSGEDNAEYLYLIEAIYKGGEFYSSREGSIYKVSNNDSSYNKVSSPIQYSCESMPSYKETLKVARKSEWQIYGSIPEEKLPRELRGQAYAQIVSDGKLVVITGDDDNKLHIYESGVEKWTTLQLPETGEYSYNEKPVYPSLMMIWHGKIILETSANFKNFEKISGYVTRWQTMPYEILIVQSFKLFFSDAAIWDTWDDKMVIIPENNP
ncbi:MAG: hypothetical protein AAB482_03360 [Patescibacteria group bacterium]